MALDICQREVCGYETTVRYKPIEGKYLLFWPDSKCMNSLNAADASSFLRRIRQEYGFSLLLRWNDHIGAEIAINAGWDIRQIVLNGTGSDLADLASAYDIWVNAYADAEMAKRGLRRTDDYILWEHFKSIAPPFHSVFYDEPWSKPMGDSDNPNKWPIIIKDSAAASRLVQSLLAESGGWESLLSSLCSNIAHYNELFRAQQGLRLVLMSLYVHNCLDSKYLIGEFNQIHRNHWRLMLSTLDGIQPSPYWPNWVDDVLYQGYAAELIGADQSAEWRTLHRTGRGNRVIMSLDRDQGEFDVLFKTVNSMGVSEVWLFPQAADANRWSDCKSYERFIRSFCDAAARHGFLERIETRELHCTTYIIPGCREGDSVPAELYYNPLRETSFDPFRNWVWPP